MITSESPVYRSYNCLQKSLKRFFGDENFCYVDPLNPRRLPQIFEHEPIHKPLNCVLVGASFSRILESMHWPKGTYRIWVLSSAHRNILIDIYGMPAPSVGLIPRSQLFPQSQKLKSFKKNNFTLVYGGRLATVKGIFQILEFTWQLQHKYKLNSKLILSAPLDEILPVNRNITKLSNSQLKKKINTFIDSRNWLVTPHLVPDKDPDNWFRLPKQFKNPVFISLSQHTHEDFGVALAQAQKLGWPCILSPWGAHLDAKKPNVWMTPPFDVFAKSETNNTQMNRMTKQFIEFLKNQKNEPLFSKTDVFRPVPLSAYQLKKICVNANSKYPGLLKFSESRLYGFYRTKPGKKFFHKIDKILTGY